MRRKIIFLFSLLLLTACSEKLPKDVENHSIIGEYVYFDAYFLGDSPHKDHPTVVRDPSQQRIMDERYLDSYAQPFLNNVYLFMDNGVFSVYHQYTQELLSSGFYTYDGENLKLYNTEKKPYTVGTSEWEMHFKLENSIMSAEYQPVELGFRFLKKQEKAVESSSSETQ